MVKKTTILSIFTIFLLSFSMGVWATQDDAGSGHDAPGNIDSPDIPEIALNTAYSGTIGTALTDHQGGEDTDDFFSFFTTTGFLTVEVNASSTEFFFYLDIGIHFDETELAGEGFINEDGTANFTVPILANGTLFLKLSTFSENVAYSFILTWHPGTYSQNDANGSQDSDVDHPIPVQLNTVYNATIGNGHVDWEGRLDTLDYFAIDLPGQGYLTVNFSILLGQQISISLGVENDYGSLVYSQYLSDEEEMTFDAPIGVAGNYFLTVLGFGENITYQFSLTFTLATIPPQNDAGSGHDADAITGIQITPYGKYQGTVGNGLLSDDGTLDYLDLYTFTVNETDTFFFNLTFSGPDERFLFLTLILYGKNGDEMDFILSLGAFETFSQDSHILGSGNYVIEISSSSTNVTYEFGIRPQHPPSTPTTTTNSSSSTNNATSSVTETPSTPSNALPLSWIPVASFIAIPLLKKRKTVIAIHK